MVPLWSLPKAGRKFLGLNPLGTEVAEAKLWLSASNIGRGGGGGGWGPGGGGGFHGGYPPSSYSCQPFQYIPAFPSAGGGAHQPLTPLCPPFPCLNPPAPFLSLRRWCQRSPRGGGGGLSAAFVSGGEGTCRSPGEVHVQLHVRGAVEEQGSGIACKGRRGGHEAAQK